MSRSICAVVLAVLASALQAQTPYSAFDQQSILADPGYAEPVQAGGVDCSSGCCSGCCPSPCCGIWASGAYLLWWTNDERAPALVTTSPTSTAQDVAGVLGQSSTRVLFGNGEIGDDPHSGGRAAIGFWVDRCGTQGVEFNFLALSRETADFSASSDNTPILARPVFDTASGQQAALLVAYPGFREGSISIDASTEFQMGEVLWRQRLRDDCARVDFVAGYRFARLEDSLHIRNSSEFLVTTEVPVVPGTTQTMADLFDTENEFHGGVVGVAYQERIGCWSLDGALKLAFGNTRSRVTIDGSTQTTVPGGGSSEFDGGLLGQSTNSGTFADNHLTAIPEIYLGGGCQLGCNLRLTVGYTAIFWSNVVRAIHQVDTSISQFPPEAATGPNPQFRFVESDLWIHGLTAGLDYRY